MKRALAFLLLTAMLAALLVGCGNQSSDAISQEQAQAEASGLTLHKIGVATYNVTDAEVIMFKDYLDNYIKGCFEDVTFLYSDSIADADETMEFLNQCAEEGCEGIMAFVSYDLQSEVELCASKGMYYIRPASTSSDADFEAVADNPYYVGEIGPGAALETQAAADMVKSLAEAGDGKRFLILSGGASMGNEMHRLRTVAMLETLEEVYGVAFDSTPEDLALTSEVCKLSAGDLTVCISPGYLDIEQYSEAASAQILSGEYDVILSTVAVTPLMDALSEVEITCGTTDCFSEDNYFGFKKGKISYVAGKYQAEIGPAFAALYNAICGNPETFRENGRAFRLEQGYWTASTSSEYDSMYALACGAAINAYNYEDLYAVVQSITPEASFEDFKALVASYSYDDCLARRSA